MTFGFVSITTGTSISSSSSLSARWRRVLGASTVHAHDRVNSDTCMYERTRYVYTINVVLNKTYCRSKLRWRKHRNETNRRTKKATIIICRRQLYNRAYLTRVNRRVRGGGADVYYALSPFFLCPASWLGFVFSAVGHKTEEIYINTTIRKYSL